jgi:hypothetical protein
VIIKITNIYSEDQILQVSFHSVFGNGIAEWFGSPPEIGQKYNIEVTFDELFCLGENIEPSSNNIELFYTESGKTHLTAKLISIDDDRCAAICINGSMIFLELDRTPEEKPSHINLTTTQICFFPASL